MSELQSNVEAYIKQLSEKEKIVFEIAKKHLETSFDISKSNGFKQYLKDKK